jgi:hypothetical protein
MEGLKKELSAILAAFGDESVLLLREYHEQAGQVATGTTLSEFMTEQEETDTGLKQTIFGSDYVYFLEHGRGPGGFPPVDMIRQWAEAKGLFRGVEKQYQRNSIAYLIGRKIAQEGSFLYRNKQTFSGFESPIGSVFNDERMEKLKEELGAAFVPFINSQVVKAYMEESSDV